MKKLIFGAVALAGVVMSLPAHAQVGYGFGEPRYRTYYEGDYRPDRRHDYNSYDGDRRTCHMVRVWTGDHYRRVRRCF